MQLKFDFTMVSDQELEAGLVRLVKAERENLADVLEHLSEFDTRDIALRKAFPSLFAYCTRSLGYSESAAGKRIYAARAARKYPLIYEMLRSGALHLVAVVMLHRYLEPDNHRELLTKAAGMTRVELEVLVAALAPTADKRDVILPLSARMPALEKCDGAEESAPSPMAPPIPPADAPRSAPPELQRARIAFTAGPELVKKIRRAQELMRHKYPDGSLAGILEDALETMLDKRDPWRRIARMEKRRAARG